MLLTLLGNLNMFGSTPPTPTPSKDSSPTIFSKPDEGGRNDKKEDENKMEQRINQSNEDIAVILASWLINNN